MDLEASIVERLQRLKEWQQEQQKQLLKQQQIQREMLTQKQDSIFKALELSIQELDLNEDIAGTSGSNVIDCNDLHLEENFPQILNDKESYIKQNVDKVDNQVSQEQLVINSANIDSHLTVNTNNQSTIKSKEQSKDKMMSNTLNDINIMLTPPKHETQIKQFIMDGIAPLPPDKVVANPICIDDLPVPSPRKDFHALLEEKLKDCENVVHEKSNTNVGNKIKKPFLRKGEGLSRFRLNQSLHAAVTKSRAHSTSLSNKHYRNGSKNSSNTQSSKTRLPKNASCTSSAQKQLSLKNVPPPKNKLRSKSESNTSDIQLQKYINEIKNTIESNTSDFQCGTQEELEEVRIFELLEEKAQNSSFCSTSSAVIAFLQQSTPFKITKRRCNTENDRVNVKQQATPISKNLENQSTLNSKQTYRRKMLNNSTDSYYDLIPFINQNVIQDYLHKSLNLPQSTSGSDKIETASDTENDNEMDVSLHVRFSEYNEYKTIGLTDTSSISNESRSFLDGKAWSDSSTPEPPIETCKVQNNSFNSYTNTHQGIFRKDESVFSDQTSDSDENTLLNYSQDSSASEKIGTSNNVEELQFKEGNDNEKIDKHVDIYDEGVSEVPKNEENAQEPNKTVFTSELLKNRLLELEQEINIFRKENTALTLQRKKLQEDYKNLYKEYAAKEKSLEENRRQMENRIQDEKKKLAREKTALENRMKDSQEKAQQNKLERQQMQQLKEEVERLREEIYIKESRWNAAQSRQKCQMRILKMENSKLKQEIERLQNSKKATIKTKGKLGTHPNTRAIHQINKQLNMQLRESKNVNDSLPNDNNKKSVQSEVKTSMIYTNNTEEDDHNCNRSIVNKKLQKFEANMTNIAKKRSLYDSLIKEATSNMMEVHEQTDTSENSNELKSDLSSKFKQLEADDEENDHAKNEESDLAFDHNLSKNVQLQIQNDYVHVISPNIMSKESHSERPISSHELSHNSRMENVTLSHPDNSNIDKQPIKQIQHPDGSLEYHFPNGNVKKVFPDQGLTRLIYYNGDIRETNKDGKIKYFYASTRTWHTTMPDGLEILEFADGQIERRSNSGTVEVSFPDGSVRIVELDGTEKWTLPDGTLIQILTNGEKVLTLPNGQQEIHTKTHKRREYPDGTTKFIYPDGTQETRYSNGRIRLKDKDGNLLMDSYQ